MADTGEEQHGGSAKTNFKKNTNNRNKMKGNKFKKNEKVKFYPTKVSLKTLEEKEVQDLLNLYNEVKEDDVEKFSQLPLSHKTQQGLKKAGYFKPTEIQKRSILLSLQGKDVLGAAKTGSGKTIAFIIPVLEKLFREHWTPLDGVGALIITPTRELAYQIFEVLKKVGTSHEFSAGLIIGGKDLKFERERMDKCNIVICTPGRILQHMDENPLFDCTNLQILVLDEADRILDLGFEKSMNAIIENLPLQRQTLLFSATQTKSVKDLARLSLKEPEYVSVHEHSQFSTPEALKQSYVVCELHEKMDLLWSFFKSHKKQKILIFLSSCKQVKYAFEVFCRLRPGTTVLSLYGSLHQLRRMAIYDEFCRKESAILLATDIAARGLDFPSVHWVVQLDCPEDVNTYIHRAGRTARYEKDGQALLVLLPSEENAMVQKLQDRKIPLNKIHINSMRIMSVQRKMEAICARDVNLKQSAQRAFVAYVKSIFLMKDKSVFDVYKLDTNAYARSLGLAIPPRIRFLQKQEKLRAKQLENKNNLDENTSIRTTSSDNASYSFYNEDEEDDSSSDDGIDSFLTKKKSSMEDRDNPIDDDNDDFIEANLSNKALKKLSKPQTKAAVAKKLLKKNFVPNKKVLFNEEGEAVEECPTDVKSQVAQELRKKMDEKVTVGGGIDIEIAKQIMAEEDKFDKQLFNRKIKAAHREEKRKLKLERLAQKGISKRDESEGAKAYSGTDSEEEEDDETNELIDTLPDPDKIYDKSEDKDVPIETDQLSLPTPSDSTVSKKRKRKKDKNVTKKKKKEQVLDAVEDLALQLLQ